MSDKWENPNSKLVDYGGPLLGGCAVTLCFFFYPAIVVGIQTGLYYTSYDDAMIPGTIAFLITLFVIWILFKLSQLGSPICSLLLILLYLICMGPAAQYFNHISNADYLDKQEYQERCKELSIEWDPCIESYDWPEQAPFPGFDWFWFLSPTSPGKFAGLCRVFKVTSLIVIILCFIGLVVHFARIIVGK